MEEVDDGADAPSRSSEASSSPGPAAAEPEDEPSGTFTESQVVSNAPRRVVYENYSRDDATVRRVEGGRGVKRRGRGGTHPAEVILGSGHWFWPTTGRSSRLPGPV